MNKDFFAFAILVFFAAVFMNLIKRPKPVENPVLKNRETKLEPRPEVISNLTKKHAPNTIINMELEKFHGQFTDRDRYKL